MLAEIAVIEETVHGLDYASFSRNQQALRVVLYSLAVIGEAVTSAISELKAADSTMPWEQIKGMRNVVIHEYFRVDVEIIWETIQNDILILKRALLNIQNCVDKTEG
jgi:uncharacterized protein with HEPN domain